jgi:hypothetical protein
MPEWGSRWVDGIPAELRAVARMRCAVASGHGQWAAPAVRAACDGAVGALVEECERRAEVDAAVTAVVDAVVAEEERARRARVGAVAAAWARQCVLAPAAGGAAARLTRRWRRRAAERVAVEGCLASLLLQVEVRSVLGRVVREVELSHVLVQALLGEVVGEAARELGLTMPLSAEDREAEALLEMLENEQTELAEFERRRAVEAAELRRAVEAEEARRQAQAAAARGAREREKRLAARRRTEAAAAAAEVEAAAEAERQERLRAAKAAARAEVEQKAALAQKEAAQRRGEELAAQADALRRGGLGGGGESFPRVYWVAVPEVLRARRVNRRGGGRR